MTNENISVKFFDPKLPTEVVCGSAKFGIGATL